MAADTTAYIKTSQQLMNS